MRREEQIAEARKLLARLADRKTVQAEAALRRAG
jgi:hypothetical protein